MKKQWFITPALILLIIVGLVLIVNKPIRNKMIETKTNDNQIENVSKETIEQNEEAPATFDATEIKPVSTEDVVASTFTQSEKSFLTVAGIAIPELNMNLPIYKGLDSTSLMYGAGTMKENQELGKGNYALASHHVFGSNGGNLLFSPLTRAQVGMTVYVTDKDDVYTYKITNIETVTPDRGDVINDGDEPELTLVTCTDADAKFRTIVKAKYVSHQSYDSSDKGVQEAFKYRYSIPWW